jgi:arylsulfatase
MSTSYRLLACALLVLGAAPSLAAERPNVLIVLADDLGWSDLGCYGGEIQTPHLDELARQGVRFTQFYTCARCCPSRAALLTGLYPHQAGVGLMTGDQQLPGYRGHLTDRCVTVAELLGQAGYYTCMSGKWHLAKPGPTERGFADYYGMLGGFGSFWDAGLYQRLPAGRPQRTYEKGRFYATDAITDHALDFLAEGRKQEKPFFLYLAYNAPHFPLHAPKEVIDRYVRVYEKGWDTVRAERHRRQKEAGLVRADDPLSPRAVIPPDRMGFNRKTGWAGKANPAWDDIPADRRTDLARRMAVFAAMVEVLDRNVGRVLADLREHRQLDNTLVLFLSDNGACAEWDPWGFDGRSGPDNVLHQGDGLARMGQPGTYHSYGSGWAHAGSTPWKLFKHYAHEGGIASPLIVHWPAGVKRAGKLEHQPGHLIDLLPTCLDAAGVRYPAEFAGRKPLPPEGVSLRPAFAGEPLRREGPLCWEHEGNRAIRSGKWKLVGLDGEPWELYDLDADRAEQNDLAARMPGQVKELAEQYETWAKRCHVVPRPPGRKKP